MQGKNQENAKSRQYLEGLMHKYKNVEDHEYLYESVGNIMKKSQQGIEQSLQNGSLIINQHAQDYYKQNNIDYMAKKKSINPFQSHYRGFFLNSDRQKSKERFQIFKKIKEQYSKQKTTLVVKQVQKKIKEWAEMKTQIEKKKKHETDKKQQIQFEMIEHMKRSELQRREMQKEQRKLQLMNRKRMMQQKKQQRQEFMKESLVRSLDMKQPKYKQIEKKYSQLEEKLKEQKDKFLEQKRNSMVVKKEDMIEHVRKYEQIRKLREEQRKSKVKYEIKQNKGENKQTFDLVSTQNREKKEEKKEKRKKMIQFGQKIKRLILNAKNKEVENQEEKDRQLQEQRQKEQKEQRQRDIQEKIQSSRKLRVRNRTIDPSANGRELGNNYLRQLKDQDRQKLNTSKTLPKLNNSISLPSIKPTYKNYLTEIKIKRRPLAEGQIQKLKRSCTSKQELYQILNKKSYDYEETILKRINELKRVDKYDESVVKESQIDEMYTKCLKLKLACINV